MDDEVPAPGQPDELTEALRLARGPLEQASLLARSSGAGLEVVSAVQDSMANVHAWQRAAQKHAGVFFPLRYPTSRADDPTALVTICVLKSDQPFPKAGPPISKDGQPGRGITFHYACYLIFDDGTVKLQRLMQRPPSTAGPDTAS